MRLGLLDWLCYPGSGLCVEEQPLGVSPRICGYDGENGPPASCAPVLDPGLFGPGVPGDTGLCFQLCHCAGYCDYPLNPDGTEREHLPCD